MACLQIITLNCQGLRDKSIETIEVFDLKYPFRELYPNLRRYTWKKKTPLKQARLDFFLKYLITSCLWLITFRLKIVIVPIIQE